jgi:hypothetical protein
MRKMTEQDDTVLLEAFTNTQHTKIQKESEQLYISRKMNQSLYKTKIITYTPFIIFFISLCILMAYLLMVKF